MSTTIQQIGKRLCARRNQMNLTQEQLAERANVTAQTISYAELGKKAMRADTIIGVCNALKISAGYLLFGEMAPKDFSALEENYPSFPQASTVA
nr:helix-turn-helix transcriptional regulator [uncultured Oscillibacter sp.]